MPKILIVDDEPFVRRSLQKTLQREGYVAETAGDCSSGLEAFLAVSNSKEPFDLAILDLNMPDFDGRQADNAGLDLMEKILEIRNEIPVVILSAYDEAAKAKAAIRQGAAHYWVKGREEGLSSFIRKILGEK
jgi:YesN/AraC family two-component response regulator